MKLLIDEPPIQFLPSLAKAIGLNEAILLQQIHYWLSKSEHIFDGRAWVYNTADAWAEQIGCRSAKTIRRTIASLEKQELIEKTDRFNKRKYDKTHWFTINYSAISHIEGKFKQKASGQPVQSVAKASGQVVQMEVDNLSTPIPETTREKTPSAAEQPPARPSKKETSGISDHAWLSAWWCYAYQTITGEKYAYTKKEAGQLKQLLKLLDFADVLLRACSYLTMPAAQRFPRGAPTIGGLLCQINELSDPDDQVVDQLRDASLLPAPDVKIKRHQPWRGKNHE